jgi:hypothetical protein
MQSKFGQSRIGKKKRFYAAPAGRELASMITCRADTGAPYAAPISTPDAKTIIIFISRSGRERSIGFALNIPRSN